MPTVRKLSKTIVDALPVPATGQTFHWCSVTPGFAVRMTANGSRSYIVQGRVDGKTCRYTIGPCNLLGTDEARRRAQARLLEMHDGKDPQVERKRRQAQGVTLRETMVDYIKNKRTKHGPLRSSSKADIERFVTKQLSDWADKPVVTITREACIKRFRELSAAAPITANQPFRNLRALLNWAREANVAPDGSYPILAINPVVQAFKSVQWNREEAREERIPLLKVGDVWRMLSERADPHRYHSADVAAAHLIQYLILTGARIGEGSSLKWSQVRLDDDVPSFTLDETKNHNTVIVPMSTTLHALMTDRHGARRKNEEYVFPSRAGTAVGHMRDARGTMQQVSKIAGLHLHNHDLRRTFIAIALDCGVQLWQAEILTNHIPESITLRHYTETRDLRYLLPQVQRVADWITEQARIARAVADGENVVPIRA